MLRKFIVLGVLGMLPSLVMAKQDTGDWELTLSGNGGNNKEFSAGNFGVNLGIGYFFTPQAEVVLRQNFSYSDNDHDRQGDRTGGSTAWDGSTRVAFDWHFDLDAWQPFVGANIGYVYGDSTRDTWIAGLEAGLKYYIQTKAFLYAQAEYQFDLRGKFGDGGFVYGVGIGVNF